jgi:hypothetical protein
VIVDQPCYCTREQVRRALDVKLASYANEQIDRAICSAADAVEGLAQRKFYPQDKTVKFDWPNFQYAYPWRVWLDNNELAAPATLVTTGSLLAVPIVIPQTAIIYQPVNDGPPFNRIELRRDMNYGFGNNTTPQLDIAITGTFGYWTKTRAAGNATANISNVDSSISVSDGISIGVGDVVIADSERMLVIDANFGDTGIAFSGLQTASANDNIVMVADGTKFTTGEVLQVDAEWILIVQIMGNTMMVKRGWSGSVLAAHTGGTLWARRTLAVLRGQLGTTAAVHNSGVALAITEVPSLVRQVAVAEAEVWLTQEPSAYGGSANPQKTSIVNRGGFAVSESIIGAGLPDLRQRLCNSRLTRKIRTRVI